STAWKARRSSETTRRGSSHVLLAGSMHGARRRFLGAVLARARGDVFRPNRSGRVVRTPACPKARGGRGDAGRDSGRALVAGAKHAHGRGPGGARLSGLPDGALRSGGASCSLAAGAPEAGDAAVGGMAVGFARLLGSGPRGC